MFKVNTYIISRLQKPIQQLISFVCLLLCSLLIMGTIGDLRAFATIYKVTDKDFGDLKSAFSSSGIDNGDTIKYNAGVISTTFAATDKIILSKQNLTLDGDLGNDTRVTLSPASEVARSLALFSSINGAGNGFSLQNMTVDSFDFDYTGGIPVDIQGGGVIGAFSDTSADASVGNISGTSFTDIMVDIKDRDTQGGGLIGAFSNQGSAASVGNISDTSFTNTKVIIVDNINNSVIEGGGLIGAYSEKGGGASVGNISDTSFIGTWVETAPGAIEGGGLIGAWSIGGGDGAIVGDISNTTFTDTTVKTKGGSTRGGGIIGAFSDREAGFSSENGGIASVGNISDTTFTNTKVETGITVWDFIEGGGIIGSYSMNTSASVGDISRTSFTTTTVQNAARIRGGGFIGALSMDGDASVGNISDTTFIDTIGITNGFIHGGGIIGAHSRNDENASVGVISDNTSFENTKLTADGIQGGGIIGVYSTGSEGTPEGKNGTASVGNISDTTFIDTKIELTSGTLQGGGIIGSSSNSGSSTVGDISKTNFTRTEVTAGSSISGGGIIGATLGWSNVGSVASVGNISNTHFIDTTVKTGNAVETAHPDVALLTNIGGGGIIGAYSIDDDNPASVGDISDTSFTNTTVEVGRIKIDKNDKSGVDKISWMNINGGGLIGALSMDGAASVGNITDTIFTGLTNVTTDGDIVGGGLIGAVSYGDPATIGNISDTSFTGTINVKVGRDIQGGGLIGAYSAGDVATIGDISKMQIENATVSAGGSVYGGIVYVQNANADGMTITDSSFRNNTATSTGGKIYGMVSFDTSSRESKNEQKVILKATEGKETVFQNNTIGETPNSLYFGNMFTGEYIPTPRDSNVNASLEINPELGGTIALYDPIMVEMNNGKTFKMNVSGLGDFTWGGDNVMDAAGGATVSFGGGSNTTFHHSYTLRSTASNKVRVNFEDDSNVIFDLSYRDKDTPLFEGDNTDITIGNIVRVAIGGHVDGTDTVHAPGTEFLLAAVKSITGEFVNEGDSFTLNQGISLKYEAKLIRKDGGNTLIAQIGGDTGGGDTGGGDTGGGDTGGGDTGGGDTGGGDTGGGDTGGGDTGGGDTGGGGPTLQEQAVIPVQALMGSTIAINQSSNFISGPGMSSATAATQTAGTADENFMAQSSDNDGMIEVSYNNSRNANKSNSKWSSFSAINAGNVRYKSDSTIDISGFSLLTGIAKRFILAQGDFLLGVFLEFGKAKLDTKGSFDTQADVRGSGNSEYISGGILGRFSHKSGIYTDASVRVGSAYTAHSSDEYAGYAGQEISFETTSTYYSTHLSLGYNWELFKVGNLDVYGKYFWTYISGNDAIIAGDTFTFEPINSNRVHLGARYTHYINEYIHPFIGATYEYEFDSYAKSSVHGIDLDSSTLRGSTGIFDLGIRLMPKANSPIIIDLGIEAYTGRRQGFMTKLQFIFEF